MDRLNGEKIAIYARISTAKQSDNDESISDQITRCKAFAMDVGCPVVGTYVELGPGFTTSRPRAYQQMVADACWGKFEAIVLHSPSRLSRNAVDYAKARAELGLFGVELVTVAQ